MFSYVVGSIVKVNGKTLVTLDLWDNDHNVIGLAAYIGEPGLEVKGWRLTSPRIIESVIESVRPLSHAQFLSTPEVPARVVMKLENPREICCAHGHVSTKTVLWNGIPTCERFLDEVRAETLTDVRKSL